MRELGKVNNIGSNYELLRTNCGSQCEKLTDGNCPKLICVCNTPVGNTSTDDNDDILF